MSELDELEKLAKEEAKPRSWKQVLYYLPGNILALALGFYLLFYSTIDYYLQIQGQGTQGSVEPNIAFSIVGGTLILVGIYGLGRVFIQAMRYWRQS